MTLLLLVDIQYFNLSKFRGFRPSGGEMWSIDCGLRIAFFVRTGNLSLNTYIEDTNDMKMKTQKRPTAKHLQVRLARAWHHGSSLSLVFWVHRPTVKLCGLGSHHQKWRATSPQVWPAGPGLWTLARDLCQLLANIRDPISRERAEHRFTRMIWWLRTEDDLIATEWRMIHLFYCVFVKKINKYKICVLLLNIKFQSPK